MANLKWLLFITTILILSIVPNVESKFLFDKSEQVKKDKKDKHKKIIKNEYMIFFDIKCLDKTPGLEKKFISEVKSCMTLNEKKKDKFPKIINHWIVLNRNEKKRDCKKYDKDLEWNDYCITYVTLNDINYETKENECKQRDVMTQGKNLWHLNRATPGEAKKNLLDYIEYDPNFDPKMDIIVMDSGIDDGHAEFENIPYQLLYDRYDKVEPYPKLTAHGTHVAGTIVGNNYGIFRAENTKIKLLGVRVFDDKGEADASDIINGYDAIENYLIGNPERKAIINLSLGGGKSAAKDARLKDIKQTNRAIIVVAAGNEGRDASNYSPANSKWVITVGNSNKANRIEDSSNFGTAVDIWAPGTRIRSAIPRPDPTKSGSPSDLKTGTSMAAPFVSGIAANIWANNPTLDFDGVKDIIINNAKKSVQSPKELLGVNLLPRATATCKEYCQDAGSKCDTGAQTAQPNNSPAMKYKYNQLYYNDDEYYYDIEESILLIVLVVFLCVCMAIVLISGVSLGSIGTYILMRHHVKLPMETNINDNV